MEEIRPIQPHTLALEPLAERDGAHVRSRLIVDGEDTGAVVEGLVLEATLALEHGTLLFTTHDCPHEESLEVHLFDRRWQLLERLSLGVPYASGILRDVRRVSPTEVCFCFFGEDEWCVVVGPPVWRLHPWSATLGHFTGPVARPLVNFISRSRLRLEGEHAMANGRRVRVRD